MDLNLSEICIILGERIEQYKNSASKKRKLEKETTLMKTKYAKLKITNTESPSKNAEVTPRLRFKPSPPASLSFATKIMPIGETPKRRVMRVHKKIISKPGTLIFYDSDDFDD